MTLNLMSRVVERRPTENGASSTAIDSERLGECLYFFRREISLPTALFSTEARSSCGKIQSDFALASRSLLAVILLEVSNQMKLRSALHALWLMVAMMLSTGCQNSKPAESQLESANPETKDSTANISVAEKTSALAKKEMQALVAFSAFGLDRSEITASAEVQKGTLNLGDVVEGISKSGTRLEVSVTYIKVDGKEGAAAEVGKKATVQLTSKKGKMDLLGEDFYLVQQGGRVAPLEPSSRPVSPATSAAPEMTVTLDGSEWTGSGSDGSHLFYAKGIATMHQGRPYMLLAFRALQGPDDRRFTISVFDFDGKAGKLDQDRLEVLVTGSKVGDAQNPQMQGHKVPTQSTNFVLEITDYKSLTANEATISGRFSGTLKGILSNPDLKVENGKFKDVKVRVYPDRY